MSDQYLWDRTGEPDLEIARLEGLLSVYRRQSVVVRGRGPHSLRGPAWFSAIAAILILGAFLGVREYQHRTVGWDVTIAGQRRALAPGEIVETNLQSRALLRVGNIGEVELGPGSRARLLEAAKNRQKIFLEHGSLKAHIVADPWVFLVESPSFTAYDMGCAYEITIDESGNGYLRVTSGWVNFQGHDVHRALVIEGAVAEITAAGPGVPYFEDAPADFRVRLRSLSDESLNAVLAEARPRDAITLINLFWRLDTEQRGRVFDRLAALWPPPPGVNRERAVSGDYGIVGEWWPSLGMRVPRKLPAIVRPRR
jgi:hypothetical protein